ncbi:MAG TPA: HAMP domain-containing sensor histidine kinase [Acidimicrobiales bacterium]|nr:HAMP domain-containing sensor histidine kinase [Acidimicrobiales bacterium]
MRRRLTLALVATVVAALAVLVVVGTVAAVAGARATTERELRAEAAGLAASVTGEAEAANRRNPAQSLHTVLAALRAPLRLDGAAVLALDANGRFVDPITALPHAAALPGGLRAADLEPAALLAGVEVSGRRGGVVFAAQPYPAVVQVGGARRSELEVVVLARRPPTGLAAAGLPVLLTVAALVVVAAAVGGRIATRTIAPLTAVREVTARIAGGDLAARVPVDATVDPELAELATSVNTMAEGLGAARGAERQFLLSISHELRTPLTSIRGFAEAIEDGAVTDVRRAAGVIGAEAARLERLVRDLLVLARIETRRFDLVITAVDAGGAVTSGVAGFEPAAAAAGLALKVVATPVGLAVRADADRLAQVLANLVENALGHARTAVAVGAARHGDAAVLWVDDDGGGIDAADLPHVFERGFVAAPRANDRPGGTGLGLAIVAELVAAMGGSVRAESPLTADGGTRMVVVLPAAVAAPGGAPASAAPG